MTRIVELDYETASRADLTKVGAWKYAADDSTFVLCVQIKVEIDGRPMPTRVLTEAQIHARDPELMALMSDPKTMFLCHNAGFEQAIGVFQMEPLGYPHMPPERWHDTMAVCGYKALPLGLDAAITALQLPIQKDMEGHRHMLRMCKPDLKNTWDHHTPENLQRLYGYGATDVEAQLGLYHATQGLGRDERETWILDQYIQQRGILIDLKFVHACIDVLDQVRVPMTERFREITGLNPTQREKVLNWVNDQGVRMTDLRKETLNAILDPDDEFDVDILQEPLPSHVYEVIDLRRSLASSSVTKLRRMLECAGYDGRVRYTTQYHGARTGRDVGRLIQIQNYPRGEIGGRQGLTAEILADAIMTRNLDTIRELWGPDIFTAVISSLRSAIVAPPGKVLCTADYATVEARNLLSFAGVHDRVDAIVNGDDPYNTIGALIYKRPIDRKGKDWKEGALSKNAFLGSGYGLGSVGFHARYCPKEPMELAELAINTYRREFTHGLVPRFWHGLFQASVDAVWSNDAKTYSYEGIDFRRERDFLTMRLPDGKKIWYHRPQRDTTFFGDQEKPSWSFMNYQGKKFRRIMAWHGMITADFVQGSARQLIMAAAKRSVKAGLTPIFKVHDEIVFEETDAPDLKQRVKQVMEDLDPWAIERRLRVKAEVNTMLRYMK